MASPISPTGVWLTENDTSHRAGGMRSYEATIVKRINWGELCSYASKLNNGVPCTLLPHLSYGGCHMVRILEFKDEAKTRWIARISMDWPTSDQRQNWYRKEQFLDEITIMEYINDQLKDRSPVPKVFGYDLDAEDRVGSRFVFMEYIRGVLATHVLVGRNDSRYIPPEHRPHLYKSLARAHALLASVRVPKIGKLIRQEDGTFTVGPSPIYGGPFDTAKDFFRAWAKQAMEYEFEVGQAWKAKLKWYLNRPDDLKSCFSFPHALLSVLDNLSPSPFNEGPFPILHPDLDVYNIITDSDYNVMAVIDWDHAKVVPWELMNFPDITNAVPKAIRNYDLDDEDIRFQQEYIAAVAEAEQAENLDSNFSQILGNQTRRDLGWVIHRFWGNEAARDYLPVLEPFCDPNKPLDLGPELNLETNWLRPFKGLWSIVESTLNW